MRGVTFSLISGFLAATASLCGKFSMTAEKTLIACESLMENIHGAESKKNSFTYTPICQNVLFLTRVGFFIAMMICNAFMWTFFTKALRLCSTTLEATITNTAANFLFTAIYGQVFFGESLTFLWWMGTTLILIGLALMQKAEESTVSTQDDAKPKDE